MQLLLTECDSFLKKIKQESSLLKGMPTLDSSYEVSMKNKKIKIHTKESSVYLVINDKKIVKMRVKWSESQMLGIYDLGREVEFTLNKKDMKHLYKAQKEGQGVAVSVIEKAEKPIRKVIKIGC